VKKKQRRPARPAKKKKRELTLREFAEISRHLNLGEIIGTGYAVTSFPIHEGQSWSDARFSAQLKSFSLFSSLHPAGRWPGGLIAGLDWGHRYINEFEEAFAAMPSNLLYLDAVSELKSAEPHAMSARQLADEALTILAAVAHEEMIYQFLDVAVSAAFRAAVIVAIDAAAKRPEKPEVGTWWAAYGPHVPAVRRFTDAEREQFAKDCIKSMRVLLREILSDSDELIRKAGRKDEEKRDHRAFCLRERLVRSPEFANLKKNERFARAKERVIDGVIAPAGGGCSMSNYQRIMDAGRAIHQRLQPGTPFCETDEGSTGNVAQ
jgi:hypothetical protein